MKRCNWDGTEINEAEPRDELPPEGVGDPFQYLPPEVPFTSQMAAMAERYVSNVPHAIDYRFYPAFQAAAHLRPQTPAQHEKRRTQFASLQQQTEAMGFQLPESLTRLVTTDAYVDRLHHGAIWLGLPEELWRLPADTEKLMFFVFREEQGGCWHLLLAPDHSHRVVWCEEAFGVPSAWMSYRSSGTLPDFSKYEVKLCADSFDEWLYFFFRDCEMAHHRYFERLYDYFVFAAQE
jgi:hypothetical protein